MTEQLELVPFAATAPLKLVPKHYEIGFISVAAARKNSEVTYFSSESVEGGFILTGAAVTGTVTRGPRKGRPKYARDKVRVIVSSQEVAAEEQRYERETGKCLVCLGSGQEFASWSRKEGVCYSPCRRCGAEGKAP